MLWLANYIRQIFCKHDFDRSEEYLTTYNNTYRGKYEIKERGYRVLLVCKKCGYHTSFWKH